MKGHRILLQRKRRESRKFRTPQISCRVVVATLNDILKKFLTPEDGVQFTSKTDDKSEFQDTGSDALRRIVDVLFTGEWYGVLRQRIDYSN